MEGEIFMVPAVPESLYVPILWRATMVVLDFVVFMHVMARSGQIWLLPFARVALGVSAPTQHTLHPHRIPSPARLRRH